MADYKGFLRFSDEAVASVNWNDQQHSGEAGVTDEKTGTVYPFGGGSSDLNTAEITIKASNDGSSGLTTPNLNSEKGANSGTYSAMDSDYVIQVPLYNGLCTAEFWGDLEVTGAIVKGESTLTITGDGTITFTGE